MQLLNRDREDGFTLVELLVVVMLLGIVGGIITTAVVRGMQSSREVQQRIEGMAELQMAAERISRELRAACPITAVADDSVTASVVRDGSQWGHRFYVEAGAMLHEMRDADGDVVQSARALVTDLDEVGTAFEFFNRDGAAVTDLVTDGVIQSARFTLSRDLPQARPLEVVTQVTLRNGGRSCD